MAFRNTKNSVTNQTTPIVSMEWPESISTRYELSDGYSVSTTSLTRKRYTQEPIFRVTDFQGTETADTLKSPDISASFVDRSIIL